MGKKIRNSILLVIAAAIWGIAFAFQRMGGESMGAFTMNALRSFLGVLSMLPMIKVAYGNFKLNRKTLIGGITCGLILSVACNLQQLGLLYKSPGKAGFITASYMIFVVIIMLFMKKKMGTLVIISIAVGVAGLFLICYPEGEAFSLNKGDLLCIACAVAYAFQIIVIDRTGEDVESVKMCAIQFFVVGVVSSVLMFIVDKPTAASIKEGIIPLLYVGIMSTGVAYSFQMIGMKGLNPAVASLLMSLESVFSVVGEILIFGTMVRGRVLAGCIVMFIAIILSQSDLFIKRPTS